LCYGLVVLLKKWVYKKGRKSNAVFPYETMEQEMIMGSHTNDSLCTCEICTGRCACYIIPVLLILTVKQ